MHLRLQRFALHASFNEILEIKEVAIKKILTTNRYRVVLIATHSQSNRSHDLIRLEHFAQIDRLRILVFLAGHHANRSILSR
jgi:hypothetical protein